MARVERQARRQLLGEPLVHLVRRRRRSTAHFSPARFQAFDAEVSVTPEAAAASPTERYGTCVAPGIVIGACTSSEITVTPWRSASAATASSSRARERRAGRVVRVAEQVRPRAGGERLLEAVEIERPARAPSSERHLDDAPSRPRA